MEFKDWKKSKYAELLKAKGLSDLDLRKQFESVKEFNRTSHFLRV